MAMMAAAVKVVTTDGQAGRGGLTVTAACSVSQEPPRLLVCVNTTASAHPIVLENGRLSLNILSNGQEAVAGAFGGQVAPEKRFEIGEWTVDELGQPALEGACARFSCSIHETMRSGTHTIFVCDVHAASGDRVRMPLVYFDRNMTTLPQVA
ncbi:flavin reductase [Agrobacterium tumefaciens]|nr:flavin reductase [Agrobacterium tumefaciens]NSZ39799.1 flavin reductase [Agrobacterium tumefaciens]NTB26757.1 flavin reductase [Agrobacterium tumefaciens]NTB31849.1 flavin reductase [Agrobacterium tumefaciens]NTB34294.1 flavin reductase [Agrobacterium tumefaciens]